MANPILNDGMTVKLEVDFVDFLIGMQINSSLKTWTCAPASTTTRMLIDLARRPEPGQLHARRWFTFPGIVATRFWRSFDHLHRYTKDLALNLLPAWKAFNKAIASNGDVGIWHETILVPAGQFECVYNNMPAFGLGLAGKRVPARGARQSAKDRPNRSNGADDASEP